MELQRQSVVVDDQVRIRARSLAGQDDAERVGVDLESTVPPAPRTTDRTSASPTPRPSAPAGFVENPCSKIALPRRGQSRAAVRDGEHDAAVGRGRERDPHPAARRRRMRRPWRCRSGCRAPRRCRPEKSGDAGASGSICNLQSMPRSFACDSLAEQKCAHGRVAVARRRPDRRAIGSVARSRSGSRSPPPCVPAREARRRCACGCRARASAPAGLRRASAAIRTKTRRRAPPRRKIARDASREPSSDPGRRECRRGSAR